MVAEDEEMWRREGSSGSEGKEVVMDVFIKRGFQNSRSRLEAEWSHAMKRNGRMMRLTTINMN